MTMTLDLDTNQNGQPAAAPGAPSVRIPTEQDMDAPMLTFAHRDFLAVPADLTVERALKSLRGKNCSVGVGYIYAVDTERRLVGVIPLRALLCSALDAPIRDIMRPNVIALPQTATVLVACEMFSTHRFVAFPVVDENNRILGVVDVRLFADEVLDLSEHQQVHAAFDIIGLRLSKGRVRSPWLAFPYRFPWLLTTIGSGLLCAFVTSLFQATLGEALALAFFLTLVLGLGESIAVQSLTLTLQSLHRIGVAERLRSELGRELTQGLLLGAICAALVSGLAFAWQGDARTAAVLGASILAIVAQAGAMGVIVPTLVHRLRWDVKVAAGPITLAATDVVTLVIYFTMAALIL